MGRITTPLLNLNMTLITMVFTLITILINNNFNNGVVIPPNNFKINLALYYWLHRLADSPANFCSYVHIILIPITLPRFGYNKSILITQSILFKFLTKTFHFQSFQFDEY
jgi:hypothetical protein